MNLETLLGKLRRERLDDDVCPYLWPTEQLVGALNDAVYQVCLRQRALVESTLPAVCTYALTVGQRLVKLHPSVLAVQRARYGTENHILCGVSAARLWKQRRCWDVDLNGRPEFWVPDFQEGYLAVTQPPDTAGNLQLSVWRAPIEDELLTEDDLDAEPVVSVNWHEYLLDWAEHVLFLKKDAETLDQGRSDAAAQRFTAKVGPLPSAQEVRLWGVSRIAGVRAHFV